MSALPAGILHPAVMGWIASEASLRNLQIRKALYFSFHFHYFIGIWNEDYFSNYHSVDDEAAEIMMKYLLSV